MPAIIGEITENGAVCTLCRPKHLCGRLQDFDRHMATWHPQTNRWTYDEDAGVIYEGHLEMAVV